MRRLRGAAAPTGPPAPPIAVTMHTKAKAWGCRQAKRARAADFAFFHSPDNVQLEAVADWLASDGSITDDNLVGKRLTDEEIALFRDLEASGQALSAADLRERRLADFAGTSALQSQLASVQVATEAATAEAEELKRRLEEVGAQRNALAAALADCKAEGAALEDPSRPPVVASADTLTPTVFASVDRAVAELHAVVGEVLAEAATPSMTLSACDVQPYLDADQEYTQAATAFMEKQFHTGLAQVVDRLAEDPLPGEDMAALLKGADAESYTRMSAELKTLHGAFADAEHASVVAAVNLAGEKAFVEAAVAAPTSDTSTVNPSAMAAVRETAAGLQAALEDVLSERLPGLLSELSGLEAAPVVLGDHHLKLMRQQYHIEKQDLVLDALGQQFSRHHTLCMLLVNEDAALQRLATTLGSVSRLAFAALASYRERMAGLRDVSEVHPGVAATQIVLQGIGELLGLQDEDVSPGDIAGSISSMWADTETSAADDAGIHKEATSLVASVRDRVNTLAEVLASPAAEFGGPQLEAFSEKVVSHVQAAVDAFRERGKALHRDPLAATERAIPVAYFGGHHEELQRALDDLMARARK